MARHRPGDAVLITTARRSPRDELEARQRRYLITMGVRVVAFIASIVLFRGWLRAVAVVLSITLPWIAVVMANAGTKPIAEEPSLYPREQRRELEQQERAAQGDRPA